MKNNPTTRIWQDSKGPFGDKKLHDKLIIGEEIKKSHR
jgi:hypothetical protein